ncbi:MAG: YfcE family phosphodiesterase [Acutalibacteraceae bacterium]|nr:metallophosphoesterase [Oscillospiraceae bacterium]
MRILVMSDSHGDRFSASLAIEQQPEAKYVFHLGDGADDIEDLIPFYPDRTFVRVRGNCDFSSQLSASETVSVGGKKIYLTHGYAERVKYGLSLLVCAAREHDAEIAVFGHTHTPQTDYCDGLYLFNPGSLRDGNYGVIDITAKGIICVENKVRYS